MVAASDVLAVCRVESYARDVIAGRIAAGRWVRLACERHLRDLESGPARGLRWDADAAAHAIEFFRFLRHSKGRWNDAPFTLAPWQAFIVGSLFGWKRADGLRRFRIAFVELPRKNGKTTLAAAIALYLFVCDGEAGAEIYSAATKRDQARLVFDDACALVRRCRDLAKLVKSHAHSLQIPEARSKFEPLGADADTVDGLNPFVAICDEIHAWKTRDLWDVLLTGMGAREQPLALAITTAGDFSDSIYNELHNDAEQILEGVVADDATFGFIACVDADDDWRDPAAWAKANPNLGVSLIESELSEVIRRAERQPSSQNKVKRNRLGIRTSALNAWLRLDQWDRCGSPFDLAELDGRPCWAALDLASVSDLAALCLLFPWDAGERGQTFRLAAWLWCPAEAEDQQSEKLRRRIYPWAQAGYVEMTDGQAIDHGAIEATIGQLRKRFDVRALAFDPFNCESTAQRLAADGLKVAKFHQNLGSYTEASRAFEAAVIGGRLNHGGNPVLRWMASNTVAITNGAGHIMPSRKKSRDKIDGIVAAVMAMGCYLRVPDTEQSSIYETQGFD